MPTRTGNYVVTVLLLASVLALALTLPPAPFRQAEAQTFSRTACVYQTVYVPVYITIFQAFTNTFYATSTSYSLTYSAYTTTYPVTYYSNTTSSVTQWNNGTITWTLNQIGPLGTWPSATFGSYSDVALLVGGVVMGVAATWALMRSFKPERKRIGGLSMINPQPEPPGPAAGVLICTKCGANLSVGQKFCKGCGTALFYPPDPGP